MSTTSMTTVVLRNILIIPRTQLPLMKQLTWTMMAMNQLLLMMAIMKVIILKSLKVQQYQISKITPMSHPLSLLLILVGL